MKLKRLIATAGLAAVLAIGVGTGITMNRGMKRADAAYLTPTKTFANLDETKTYVLGWSDSKGDIMFNGTTDSYGSKYLTTTDRNSWTLLNVKKNTDNLNLSYLKGTQTYYIGYSGDSTNVQEQTAAYPLYMDNSGHIRATSATGRIIASSNADYAGIKFYSSSGAKNVPAYLFEYAGVAKVSSINVTFSKTDVLEGDSLKATAEVLPSNAVQDIEWSINTTDIPAGEAGEAVIDAHGNIVTKKAGKVNVLASSTDGSNVVGKNVLTIKANTLTTFTMEGTPVAQTAGMPFDAKGLTFKEVRSVTGEAVVPAENIEFTPALIAADTTKVTANYGGKTIEITGFKVLNQNKVTVTVADYDAKTFSGTKAMITKPDFTIEHLKNDSSTAITKANAEIRVYTDHTLTLKPAEGKVIKSIVVTTTDKKLTSSSTVTGATVEYNDTVVTITPKSTAPVVITAGAQIRMVSIEVTTTDFVMGEITTLELASAPTKTSYYVGEALDLTGMSVVGKDVNGVSKELKLEELTLGIANGTVLNEAVTDKVLTISYKGIALAETACPKITVKADDRITLTEIKDTANLKAGQQVIITNKDNSSIMGAHNSQYNNRDGAKVIGTTAFEKGTVRLDLSKSNDISVYTVVLTDTVGKIALKETSTGLFLSNSVNDKLASVKTLTDAEVFTLTYTTDHMTFENGKDKLYCHTYVGNFTTKTKNGNPDLHIYAIDGNAEQEATAYAESFIYTTSKECEALKVTTATWTKLADAYAALSLDAQKIIKETKLLGNTETAANIIEKAAQRYDYIVKIYSYDDFANRGVVSLNPMATFVDNTNMIIVIATIAVLAISAISVLFIVKHKKATR